MNIVYIVNMEPSYVRMFEDRGWVVTEHLEECDFVQFCGSDVLIRHLPDNDSVGSTDYNHDRYTGIWLEALALGKDILGVQEGAYFVNKMNHNDSLINVCWYHDTNSLAFCRSINSEYNEDYYFDLIGRLYPESV